MGFSLPTTSNHHDKNQDDVTVDGSCGKVGGLR